jgi:hypothetical protein
MVVADAEHVAGGGGSAQRPDFPGRRVELTPHQLSGDVGVKTQLVLVHAHPRLLWPAAVPGRLPADAAGPSFA